MRGCPLLRLLLRLTLTTMNTTQNKLAGERTQEKSNAYRLGYNDGYCRGEQSTESAHFTVREEGAYLRGYRAGERDARR